MKKLVIATAIALAALTGCGQEKEPVVQEPTNVVVDVPAERSLAKMAPDPEIMFPGVDFEVYDPDDGECYQFILRQTTHEMFVKYTDACRADIFSEVICDLDNMFKAYTPEGMHRISVSYFPGTEDDPDNTYIYVDVRMEE